MSVDRSLYEEHLNFYSRHTRGDPSYLPDSLYYEIGRPLPDIELEFPKGRQPIDNRILSSEHEEQQREESINFDKYEVMLQGEQLKPPPVQLETYTNEGVSEDLLPPPEMPRKITEELGSSQQAVNEELNRSHDEIPLEQIFEKGEQPSNVANKPVEENSKINDVDVEQILTQELTEDVKLDSSPVHIGREPPIQEWSPEPVKVPDQFVEEHFMRDEIRYDGDGFATPMIVDDTPLEKAKPEIAVEQHKERKSEQEPPAHHEILSPRSQTKYTQTHSIFDLPKESVLRESSLESNSQDSPTPRKIPFRLAKKESKERRKKKNKKEETGQSSDIKTENSSTTEHSKPKPAAIHIELPVTLTTQAPTHQGAKKSFSKTFLNRSPINKLSNSDMDLPATAALSECCMPSQPHLSENEKKHLLSKFFSSNA